MLRLLVQLVIVKIMSFPRKTAKKYTKELGDYLKKQIKNGLILKRFLRVLLMHLNMQLRFNGMLVWLQTIRLFLKPFAVKINSEGGIIFMDQYTKTLLTIITVCAVMVTLIIVGSAIIHNHEDEHDHDYFEYMENIIERLERIEERLD